MKSKDEVGRRKDEKERKREAGDRRQETETPNSYSCLLLLPLASSLFILAFPVYLLISARSRSALCASIVLSVLYSPIALFLSPIER